MISEFEHAVKVQRRRFDSGKLGIAKAVRRCLRRLDLKPSDAETILSVINKQKFGAIPSGLIALSRGSE